MKKIVLIMILSVTLTLIINQNDAEAQEVYVGVYPASGLNAYLLTESVNITGKNPFGPMFNCTIRAGRNYYINYRFFIEGTTARNRRTCWENSDGYKGYLDENSPVESTTYKYVMNNWNWH